MRSLRRLWTLAGIFAMLSISLMAPVGTLASCIEPPPIRDALAKAEFVFVGTVTAVTERNLWATVAVEEVWRGPDLPAVIQVRGGEGGNVGTSVDREFKAGVKYLFAPPGFQDGIAQDNSCSPTREWDGTLVELRPTDARAPIGGTPTEPAGFDIGAIAGPIGAAVLVAAILLFVGLVARSRQPD